MIEPSAIGEAIMAHASATGATPAACVDHLLHCARRQHLQRCIRILLAERPQDMSLDDAVGQLCSDARIVMGELMREARGRIE
jgi:hypothetical protein